MIYYLPLEPYKERYTWQLRQWETDAFKRNGAAYVEIDGQTFGAGINTGVVLDAHGRSHWALTQTANLVRVLSEATSDDAIYITDMFQPGYEALPYILAQCSAAQRPKVFVRCHAQSVDRNDFTFPMRRWMRHYEMMVDRSCSGIFVASTVHKEMLELSMFDAPVHVVGLPFDAGEVQQRMPDAKPLHERKRRIVFSSRWDAEKQPHFYMDLIQKAKQKPEFADVEFCVCTGSQTLRSNDPTAVARALAMPELAVYTGLAKEDYYGILADSRVQFNCALQDFVSYTLLEASALGTPSLLPAHLSFPEAVFNNAEQMYIPWSIDDAIAKLERLLALESAPWIGRPAAHHDRSLDRIVTILTGGSL